MFLSQPLNHLDAVVHQLHVLYEIRKNYLDYSFVLLGRAYLNIHDASGGSSAL